MKPLPKDRKLEKLDSLESKTEKPTPTVVPPVAQPFDLVAVRDIPEIVKQDWLIEGLIPRFGDDGTAGYIFAPEKARKSLLLCDIALSVATGTDALGKFKVCHAGSVVGYFAEDPPSETSRRIHRLARARNIEVPEHLKLIKLPSLAIDDPAQQDRLLATLNGISDLRFAFLDPMVRLHSKNDNRAEELGPIHTFLRTVARKLPSTVLMLAHHTNHEGRYRGSTDYGAFGDYALHGRKRDRMTTEIHALDNRGGPPGKPFRFSVTDGFVDGHGATMKLITAEISDDDAEREMAVEQTVIAFKSNNPGMGGSDALKQLRKSGLKVSNSQFWEFWRVKT